jgi:D-xylose transport system substrate-binding protein
MARIAKRFALLLALMAVATACTGARGAEHTVRIALLLPESKTARYETHDRPLFEARIAEICPACQTLYANASQDASRQLAQAEAALTNGASVLVLDPVDSVAAGAIVHLAQQEDVPVIAYDRLVLNAPVAFYVSFDSERVGELQARILLDAIPQRLAERGGIVMLNGAPTDDNARHYRDGAHRVLDDSGVRILAEYDVPDWSPDKARDLMEQAIGSVGGDRIVGVYAANDGLAGGAIAAMRAAGISPLPPVSGQDAELAAIQRILAGDQYMTIYKSIPLEARAAADAAVALARGDRPAGKGLTAIDNGWGQVPSVVLEPVAVTRGSIDVVVRDGFWSVQDICVGGFVSACEDVGLLEHGA